MRRLVGLNPAKQLRHPHRQAERTVGLGPEIRQNLIKKGVFFKLPPKCLALRAIGRNQHAGASHRGSGSDRIVQARDIEHPGHLREAAVKLAHRFGVGAVEGDLAGRHRSGPELVLEPVNSVAVAVSIDVPRHQEERQAARARRGALWTRQRKGDLAADIRAEKLLAVQAPLVAVAFGDDCVSPDVRATLSLGHPLPGCPGLLRLAAHQARQSLGPLPGRAEVCQHASGAVGHRNRT